MSTFNNLASKTANRLKDVINSIGHDNLYNYLCDILSRDERRVVDGFVDKILNVINNDLDQMQDREYDREIDKLATMIAETIVLSIAVDSKVDRDLDQRSFNNFTQSAQEFDNIINPSRGRYGNRDRNDNRRNSRDGNYGSRYGNKRNDDGAGRDSSSSKRRERPNRDEERNKDTSNQKYQRRGEPNSNTNVNSSSSSNNNNQTRPTSNGASMLKNGDTITSENRHNIDFKFGALPLYVAGIEKLTWVEDGDESHIRIDIIEGGEKVDYDKHRTDVWLAPSKLKPGNAETYEQTMQRLNDAAGNKVKAYIERMEKKDNEEYEVVEFTEITKPSIIERVYLLNIPPVNEETATRYILGKEYGLSDVLNKQTTILTTQCLLGEIVKPETMTENEFQREYTKLVSLTAALGITGYLTSIKAVRDLLNKLNCPAVVTAFDDLMNLVISNVCTAIFRDLAVTTNWLEDYNDLLNSALKETNPITGNLFEEDFLNAMSTMMPTIAFNEGFMYVSKHTIYLPISFEDLQFASADRYGVFSKDERPELFNAFHEIQELNKDYVDSCLMNLVTTDNKTIYFTQGYVFGGADKMIAFKSIV